MDISEFAVATARGPLNCALAVPPAGELAADAALLLAFGGTRQAVLDGDSGFAPALHFVRAGHRALSFDLPNHGDFVDQYGQSIDGICAAFVAGDDPFARFVAHGKAAIDACVEKGLARPGRIFACGGSRGGYCALRLAAAEKRIGGVAGLALHNWATELAGRPVYLAIGNHDHRVGTHACVELARRLFEEEKPVEEGSSTVEVHVVQAAAHALPEEWEIEGSRFLLRRCDKEEKT